MSVDKGSFSTSSAMITIGLPSLIAASKNLRMCCILDIFYVVNNIIGWSNSTV